MWGGDRIDHNGLVVEELMDMKNLVCLNDCSLTRINLKAQCKSVLDLTLISQSIADSALWEVIKDTTIGSDHFPISCRIGKSKRNVGVTSLEVTHRGIQ